MTFFEDQRRLMSAAGLLILDEAGSIVLIKPQYKETWQLPGGFLEDGESPRQAAEREVREELGLRVTSGRLICVDFKSANSERPACLQFVFDGGVLPAEVLARIVIDEGEIERWTVVPLAEVHRWVEFGGPASRMKNALDALQSGGTVYLEDGQLSGKLG